MVYYVYLTEGSADHARRTQHRRNIEEQQVSSLAKPLEFFTMDNLRPMLKKTNRNQFVVLITDRYPKLAKMTPKSKKTALQVATIFDDNWVQKLGI